MNQNPSSIKIQQGHDHCYSTPLSASMTVSFCNRNSKAHFSNCSIHTMPSDLTAARKPYQRIQLLHHRMQLHHASRVQAMPHLFKPCQLIQLQHSNHTKINISNCNMHALRTYGMQLKNASHMHAMSTYPIVAATPYQLIQLLSLSQANWYNCSIQSIPIYQITAFKPYRLIQLQHPTQTILSN